MPTAHAEDQAKQGVTRLGEHPAVIVARSGVLVDPTSTFNLHPALSRGLQRPMEDQAKQGVSRLGEHPAVIVARRGVLVDPTSKFNLHPALMAEPSVKMPAEQYQGSVGFVTGGVGQDEAKMFEKELSKHPLAIELLEHAGKRDEFTAHAMVKIADQHGHTVLEAKADGPFMLVDLPPGRYSIQATLNNTTLKKSGVMVARDKKARVMFEFPAHADA
jgi:hypothetical protein